MARETKSPNGILPFPSPNTRSSRYYYCGETHARLRLVHTASPPGCLIIRLSPVSLLINREYQYSILSHGLYASCFHLLAFRITRSSYPAHGGVGSLANPKRVHRLRRFYLLVYSEAWTYFTTRPLTAHHRATSHDAKANTRATAPPYALRPDGGPLPVCRVRVLTTLFDLGLLRHL